MRYSELYILLRYLNFMFITVFIKLKSTAGCSTDIVLCQANYSQTLIQQISQELLPAQLCMQLCCMSGVTVTQTLTATVRSYQDQYRSHCDVYVLMNNLENTNQTWKRLYLDNNTTILSERVSRYLPDGIWLSFSVIKSIYEIYIYMFHIYLYIWNIYVYRTLQPSGASLHYIVIAVKDSHK